MVSLNEFEFEMEMDKERIDKLKMALIKDLAIKTRIKKSILHNLSDLASSYSKNNNNI